MRPVFFRRWSYPGSPTLAQRWTSSFKNVQINFDVPGFRFRQNHDSMAACPNPSKSSEVWNAAVRARPAGGDLPPGDGTDEALTGLVAPFRDARVAKSGWERIPSGRPDRDPACRTSLFPVQIDIASAAGLGQAVPEPGCSRAGITSPGRRAGHSGPELGCCPAWASASRLVRRLWNSWLSSSTEKTRAAA